MVPLPAMPPIGEALESVEVSHSDEGRSGFQITFKAERRGPLGLLDYPLNKVPQLRMFNRVVLLVTFQSPLPKVLVDGIITNIQLTPGSGDQVDHITITGEDVSVVMDQKEVTMEHPGQSELVIANKLIATYAPYGLVPSVTPPPVIDVPPPTERIPVQRGTDLQYLQDMAARYGYVFYIKAGPVPGTNTAYWGPPKRVGLPQSALSVDMGPSTNVESIRFSNDGLAPALVDARLQDSKTNAKMPLMTFAAKRMPPLAREPSLVTNLAKARRKLAGNTSGLSYAQAVGRAQGLTDASVDSVVTAQGELDSIKYGHVLEARGTVGVRGVGDTYSGLYYVKQVKHNITRGSYKQSFTLTREGTGSITPVVRP